MYEDRTQKIHDEYPVHLSRCNFVSWPCSD